MKNIIALLKKQADDNPFDIAIVDEETSITYSALYLEVLKRASIIKVLDLIKKPILIKVNRSLDTIINFFSVLLSNNYYIPVDENIPFEKLEKIIDSSNVKYCISNDDNNLGLTNIGLNKENEVFPFEVFEKDFNEDNYSYVMFTSGSTGTPKGVIKNHLNIISFVYNFTETFPFLEKERIANQTPFFFDASMKDIYLSLFLGATLFIPNKNRFVLPGETIKYLNENKITYICWVPSILSIIAKTRTLNFVRPEYLKYVFFVGEVFQPKYLNMWVDTLPSIRYFNIYGSTEVMGVSLYYEITKHVDDEIVPTGKPIKNNEVYLDDGEIIIKSKQVAVGYLNSENNKTFREKYVLATGDFATLDKDNNIVFSTRKDYQIKHMGYRIELQEIEASISNLEYIDMCCALYDEINDKIVLFITLNREVENVSKVVIGYAKEHLQFYMVPNKVIVLDKMPMNANDKIDRNELKKRI